ncbi:MAG: ribonuclease H-like domain-containing protein [Acidobacteria bacterium]|nr:ribonuclease H-like domain-containing protein [Acidobacteriota bacterium]
MTESRLTARIREVLRHSRPSTRELTYEPDVAGWPAGSERPDAEQVAESLNGKTAPRATGGQAIVIDREYAGDRRHGRHLVGSAAEDCRSRQEALSIVRTAWPGSRPAATPAMTDPENALLFVDIETTGLSGGAGMFAFLIGCGSFDGDSFRTRQIFLPAFSDEHRLLSEISALVDHGGIIVTFNGRTFDVPVMELRYLFHRRESPFGELPHVDMLHPARRLWKRRLPVARSCSSSVAQSFRSATYGSLEGSDGSSCSLPALERRILGFERFNDVPGFEIPGRYFHYLRTRDTRPLEPVLEHNRLDLLSLAVLTAVVLRLVDEGSAAAADARECLELGHLLERAGRPDRAVACYHSAIERAGSADADVTGEALLSLALACRRQKEHARAADLCERVLALRGCPLAVSQRALHILAVHHEHRSKNLHQARSFVRRSLDDAGPGRLQQLSLRLARIERKLRVEPG